MRRLSAAAVFTTFALMAPLPAFAHHKSGHPDFPRIRVAAETAPRPEAKKDCCPNMAKAETDAPEKGCACCSKDKMDMPADAHPESDAHGSGHSG